MRVKGISEQVPTCFKFRYKLFQRTLTLSGGGGGGGGGAESVHADFNLRELPCYLSNTYETLHFY